MHRKRCVIILATILITACLPLLAGQDAATPAGTQPADFRVFVGTKIQTQSCGRPGDSRNRFRRARTGFAGR